ncbi:MAG: hypothetical protein HC805_03570 [Alkalinema sp. RL_2_19]|nr:hypothetical protein [Alkalinema sp. RL_2_19]
MSNALKYAFDTQTDGQITVTLAAMSDGNIMLGISDNGCGLSSDIDWANSHSLGLQIVCSLVEQLQGRIQLEQRAGCHFKIYLPKSVVL